MGIVNVFSTAKIQELLASLSSTYGAKATVTGLEDEVYGELTPTPLPYVEVISYDANYKWIRNASTLAVILQAGTEYLIELIPSSTFTLATAPLQIGTGFASAYMVADLAPAGTTFTAGVPFTATYTPAVEGVRTLRIVGNTANVPTVNVYTYERDGGLIAAVQSEPATAETDKHVIAHKLNARTAELRALQSEVDASISALTQMQITPGDTVAATVPAGTSRLLRVGLHYGSTAYTPSASEVFFDGACRTDFTDVRFFDAGGTMLKAQLGKLVNMELYGDTSIDVLVKVSASGLLVGYNNGIVLSTDNAATWTLIAGTANVTVNASATNGLTSMYPVHVDGDDNIYAYAGGILYKLLAADAYATKASVLDFSWVDGATTIYPDIQNHAMDADGDGILYMGPYQTPRHAVVYRSTDSTGTAWEECWTGNSTDHQHVHHIHADPITGKVYVGVDDGGTTLGGARILITDDGGDTWEVITGTDCGVRGMDYYPTYFGTGYRLGGGESYYNGGGTVIRSEDDETFTTPLKGIGGVRSYADFGTDSLIVAGVQQALGTTENQIIVSEDQGRTWQTIYRKQQTVASSSGMGYRDAHGAVLVQGDTEPCVMMPRDYASGLRSVRLYHGGDHWYREAFILLDEVPSAPVAITATTGYMMGYPYKVLTGGEHSGLVYHIPLDEGVGRLVSDSEGTVARITGDDFAWDNSEEPVRYGDYGGSNIPGPFMPSSGLLLEQGTSLNFGRISALNFNGGYTVTFWINPDAYLMDPAEYAATPMTKGILSLGDITLVERYRQLGYVKRANPVARRVQQFGPRGYGWSTQFFHVAIAVHPDYTISTYVNGTSYGDLNTTLSMAGFVPANLSTEDFVLGPGLLPPAGYLSDVKVYNRVIGAAEILEMYRGG